MQRAIVIESAGSSQKILPTIAQLLVQKRKYYLMRTTKLSVTPSPSVLAAQAWIEVREALDCQLSPLGLRAMEALEARPGDIVVDIGCGTGQTALQLADRVGTHGRVIGVDISPLMLEVAQERARGHEVISFVEGDAARIELTDRGIDRIFSRFGVMAFTNPVEAFANLHRMLKPTGLLAFVCWRSLEENELDLLPLRAAGLEHMLDPTPFSFENSGRIRTVLDAAGFREIAIQAHDETVTSGELEAMVTVLLKVGPLGKILRENPQLRAEAEPRVRTALASGGNAAWVTLKAATWIVSARA